MPQALEDLKDKLLADPKFYPEKAPAERKSLAYAVANNQLRANIYDIVTDGLTPAPVSIINELNRQLTLERYSVALYYAMSALASNMNWPGFSKWLWKASHEEQAHADKIFDYLADRSLVIDVDAVPRPPEFPRDLLALFGLALDHEKLVTASLKSISKMALAQDDHTTFHFLKWYLKEQIEEENKVLNVLTQLKVAGDNASALLHVDHRIEKAR